jgi:hypothetical protein
MLEALGCHPTTEAAEVRASVGAILLLEALSDLRSVVRGMASSS